MAASRYIRDAFVVWKGDMEDVTSCKFFSMQLMCSISIIHSEVVLALAFFLEQTNLNVKVIPPFYNAKDHTISSLPETFSSSFLFISEDAILPINISEIDFAYEVCPFNRGLFCFLLIPASFMIFPFEKFRTVFEIFSMSDYRSGVSIQIGSSQFRLRQFQMMFPLLQHITFSSFTRLESIALRCFVVGCFF